MISPLNKQIAETLGWFIATDEENSDILIWIHLCTPDGDIRNSWTVPADLWEIDAHYEAIEERYGSVDDYLWCVIPDWAGDLQVAISLADEPMPVPHKNKFIGWKIETEHMQERIDDPDYGKYQAFLGHVNGYGYSWDNSPAVAFCEAWLNIHQTIKEYWDEEALKKWRDKFGHLSNH